MCVSLGCPCRKTPRWRISCTRLGRQPLSQKGSRLTSCVTRSGHSFIHGTAPLHLKATAQHLFESNSLLPFGLCHSSSWSFRHPSLSITQIEACSRYYHLSRLSCSTSPFIRLEVQFMLGRTTSNPRAGVENSHDRLVFKGSVKHIPMRLY